MDLFYSRLRRCLKRHGRFSVTTLLILIAIVAELFARVGNRARAIDSAIVAVTANGGHVMLRSDSRSLQRDFNDRVGAVDAAARVATSNGAHVMLQRPAGWPEQFGVGAWSERVYAVSFRTWHKNGFGELNCSDNEYGWNTGDRWLSDIELFFLLETPSGTKMSHCQAGDDVLRQLAAVGPDLLMLDLSSPHITDVGMAHLREFPNLRCLLLSGSSVTDKGIRSLAKLKYLQEVYLTNTAVTDACLDELLKLPRLIGLAVEGTNITPQGRRKIEQLLEPRRHRLSWRPAAQSAQLGESTE